MNDTVSRRDPSGPTTYVPTNGEGYYVCHRECADGTPCRRVVPFPRIACHAHQR